MMEYYPLGLLGQQNFEWGYLPMPAGPQGGNISCLETQVAAINARSKHKELAWDLLCLLSYDPQVQSVLYEGSEGTAVLRINEWDQELYANAAAELRLGRLPAANPVCDGRSRRAAQVRDLQANACYCK